MTEQRIFFQSDVELEGMLDESGSKRAVVICHPHPQYGGDMDNPVVNSVAAAYRQQGCTTFRFNFRGVGGSAGQYDQGRGEQRDLKAALSFLESRQIGAIDLAGYSFGAWINASAPIAGHPVRRMVMISPPVALIDFAEIGSLASLALVITGSRDTIAPPNLIHELLPRWNRTAQMTIIDGADHFYGGRLTDLENRIRVWLDGEPDPLNG